ncbi:MAG: hypothetical protein V1850_01405 [Candidatus Bathyarchaeota archaeon]
MSSKKAKRIFSTVANGVKKVASNQRFQYGLFEAGRRSIELNGIHLNKETGKLEGGIINLGENILRSVGYETEKEKTKK